MSRKISIKFLSLLSGCWAFYASASELTLNPAEQSYLQEHSEISMCVDPDWLPYEKLNAQGEHIGLVAKYMALFQSRLMITFKTIKTSSWDETQKLYQSGACDIVSALNKTPQREQYLNFTQTYIESPAVLLLNEKNQQDHSLADLSGKTLAMVKGYVYETKLREQYPEIKIVYMPNMDEALKKVSSGEVTATLGPLFLAFALTQEQGLDNLVMVGNTEYKDELRIGIKKDNKILAGMLDKAVLSLTSADHAAIKKSWSGERKH